MLAELEGVSHAAVFASGLAAENTVLRAYLRPDDEIVIPLDVYGGTYRILSRVFQAIGCVIRQIDIADPAALGAALSAEDAPGLNRIADQPASAGLRHRRDRRGGARRGRAPRRRQHFATPLFQQPFSRGADLVVHSVTKYLGGHSDLIQGAVLARAAAVFDAVKFLQNATIETASLLRSARAEDAMRHGNSADNGPLVTNVVAGLIGGLVASWTMEQFQGALGWLSEEMGGAPGGGGQQHRKPQSEPATYKAADAVAETLTGEEVPQEHKPAAGSLVHYAFGGAVGAIYGAAAARTPDVTSWGGVPFGATVWLIADEMGVPLAGLSKKPTEYPLSAHVSAFATHLVYGMTTECVRRTLVHLAGSGRREPHQMDLQLEG